MQTKRTWADPQYIKDTFSVYLLNFHYIFLFSVLQCIFTLLLLPAGAAWMAMCDCFRELTQEGAISIKTYFRSLWKYRVRGLFYSLILVCGFVGILFCLLLSGTDGESALTLASGISAATMLGITMFLPFTLRLENKPLTALFLAVSYFFSRFFSSVVVLLIIYIFFLLLHTLTPVLLLLLMPATSSFLLTRLVLANNQDVDRKQAADVADADEI